MYKAFIIWSELGAGRRHFSNYRQYIASRGLDALLAGEHLAGKRLVAETGVAAVHLVCN